MFPLMHDSCVLDIYSYFVAKWMANLNPDVAILEASQAGYF